ncbi:MAG: PAS domain S-box protein [Planctomycetaceae bacterium]|nr:PAS domain S-box protein [Planctomycetaceae bacterium]
MGQSSVPEGAREGKQAARNTWSPPMFLERPQKLLIRTPAYKYAFSVLMAGAAILLRYALVPLVGSGSQYLTIYPIVILIATCAGRWPAVVTAAISSTVSVYLFSDVFSMGSLLGPIIVILTAYLAGSLHSALDRSRENEVALAESEQRFRTLADNISQLAWMADAQGSFFWLNKRAYEYTGAAFQSIAGSAWTQWVHPSQLKALLEKTNECLRTGDVCDDTLLIRGRDGAYRWFLCRAIPIQDEAGRVIRWFGTATDIHDLKQTQQDLQESEEKFRLLAENAGAIIGIMQGERIIYANPFAEKASGYTREELYAIDIPKLIHPEYRKEMMERAMKSQAGEPIESHYEFVMVTKSGEQRWLDFSPIMINYYGRPAIVGIAIDITERKSYEDKLQCYREQLENKNKELESIIGIVSHDLRAPLVNIRGFSNELKMDCQAVDTLLTQVPVEQTLETQIDKLLHKNIPECLQYIQTSSDAMNNLVRTLVETARAGVLPLKPEKLNMNLIIKKILASIEMKAKKTGVSYGIEDLPECFADSKQVEQIFRNLLDNAIKYLDRARPGQICIGGTLQADAALYWVADNGIGISPEHQEKIFEPYYQLKEKAAGGLGMGLVTVKRMVEHNGGTIWVMSEKGKGTTLYVKLPARADESRYELELE